MTDVTVSIPRHRLEHIARVLQHLDGMQEGTCSTVRMRSTDSGLALVIDTTSAVVATHVPMDVPQFEVALSPRFVRFVAAVAGQRPTVDITIIDGTTAIHDGDVRIAIDLPADPPVRSIPSRPIGSTIKVNSRALETAFEMSRAYPVGREDDDIAPPPLWLVAEHGTLSFHVDWSSFGLGRSTFSVPASVTGERAAVAVVQEPLRALLADVDDEEVEILLPHRSSGFMQITASQWVAWLPCPDATIGRHRYRLQRLLSARGDEHVAVDERTIRVCTDPPVRVDFLAGPPEVVRLSVLLAAGIRPDEHVLAELNELNRAAIDMRVWLAGHEVVAAIDVSTDRIGDVPDLIDDLVHRVSGFGACLSGLC